MRFLLGLSAAFLCVGSLAAETVTWVPEKDIDCPVHVSVEDEARSRSVIFPEGGRITNMNAEWLDGSKIQVRVVRNSLEIQLKDPAYQAAVTAYDDRGNVYTLQVHAIDRDEPLDQRLIVVPPAPVTSRKAFPIDTDHAAIVLMRHMVGGERAAEVEEAPCTRTEGDHVVPGEIMKGSTRELTVMRMRYFQGPGLKGYTYHYISNADKPYRLVLGTVWPEGARWVSSVAATVYPDSRTEITLYPHQPLAVHYVGWFGER